MSLLRDVSTFLYYEVGGTDLDKYSDEAKRVLFDKMANDIILMCNRAYRDQMMKWEEANERNKV